MNSDSTSHPDGEKRDAKLNTGPKATMLGIVLTLLLIFPGGANSLGASGASLPSGTDRGAGPASRVGASFPCERPGWFPKEFGLKDHTVFTYDGLYYIASIYLATEGKEEKFAYASSPDLCQWTDLGGILTTRRPGGWDEFRIWAPFVYEEGGIYYMYYTGVTNAFAQSIMLATSTDPSDPTSWEERGVVLQPDHTGSIWPGFDKWSDCRDATVVKVGDLYYMYYTGQDVGGGIVGVATATTPTGPWTDQEATVTIPGAMPESPTLMAHGGSYYMFYHHAGANPVGEVYRYGPTPIGPWSEPGPFRPGWAHEVWTGLDAKPYTSYLTDYSVTIQHLTWDDFYDPPHPFIGEAIHRIFAPLIVH